MTTEKTSTEAIEILRKVYGKNIIVNLLESPYYHNLIHTGSYGLDRALGGGIIEGRIIEIFGPESGGKTTLCLHIAAEAQKRGKVAFIDVEHSFDMKYAEVLGVNTGNLIFSQPDTAEQAFEIIESLAVCEDVSLIILDSIGSLCPRVEREGDSGDANMGSLAKLVSQHIRKLTPLASKNNIPVIYINQIRAKMGKSFGPTQDTPGGHNFKHQSSVRIELKKIETDSSKEKTWQRVRARVVKNKIAPPFKEAEFKIYFGLGIAKYEELVELLAEKKIINKSGSWYSYNEEKLGQGAESVAKYLTENIELTTKLIKELEVKNESN